MYDYSVNYMDVQFLETIHISNLVLFYALTQPARNILEIFAGRSLSVAIFWASREHLGKILKEKIFKKNSR